MRPLNLPAAPGRPLAADRLTPAAQSVLVALIVLAVALLWFGTLDARHLLRSDEGRYAEMAREMFASGDWVTPRYNGVKYFEKPPFHLWVTVLAYHAFGIGEWQARLCVALSGAFGIGITMLAARRWWGGRVALLSGLALLAAPNWNLGSHFNSLDMTLSGALAGVLAATLIAQHPAALAASRRRWMLAAWAATAVAVLTKGLAGIVLPGLALIVYTAWARDWRLWQRLHLVAGTLLLLAITVPWFWLVAERNPGFLQFFFIHEHFQRYTSGVHHRSAPAWYFVPQLLVGFLPWTGLWPALALQAWQAPHPPGELQPAPLLAAWALSIFVFFSLSGSKLPGYILPIMPALALLAARALDALPAARWRRQLWIAGAVCAAIVAASPLLGRLGSASTPTAQYVAYVPWLAGAGAVALLGVVIALALQRRGRLDASIAAYGLAAFGAVTLGVVGHETFGRGTSGIDLVAPMRAVLTRDMRIYGVQTLDHTLPFYLQRELTLVESPDELEFGLGLEPDKWLPTLAAFEQRWRSGPHALAVMPHGTFDALRAAGLPMTPVAEDGRRVVVANFALPPAPATR